MEAIAELKITYFDFYVVVLKKVNNVFFFQKKKTTFARDFCKKNY